MIFELTWFSYLHLFHLIVLGLKMESSIKDELYSDIFDMSNLQSSLRPTTNLGNDDPHGMNVS